MEFNYVSDDVIFNVSALKIEIHVFGFRHRPNKDVEVIGGNNKYIIIDRKIFILLKN